MQRNTQMEPLTGYLYLQAKLFKWSALDLR